MIEHGPIGEATQAFQTFVRHYDDKDVREMARIYAEDPNADEHTEIWSIYLQTYLSSWLKYGGGVEWSGADYNAWTRIVVNIADCVMRGQVTCDYEGFHPPAASDPSRAYARPIVAIHNPDYLGHDYLDPDRYAVEVYRWNRRGARQLQEDYSDYNLDDLSDL